MIGREREATDKGSFLRCVLTVLCTLTLLAGCSSVGQREEVLALIDGEPITEADLIYSLTVKHRREDLSGAGALDLMQYLTKMIDDRLIAHEARSSGLDELPEMREAARAFVLRESIVRLHKEEIGDKVSVTEAEIKDYYLKNYEQYSLGIIQVKSERDAMDILDRLRKGADFTEAVSTYSVHPSKDKLGEIILRRSGLSRDFYKAVSSLKPGEYSDVLELSGACYILKFNGRTAPPENEYDKTKEAINRTLRKQKEKERSDEYLKCLRASARITVNDSLFAELRNPAVKEREKTGVTEQELLVDINGEGLSAGEFMRLVGQARRKSPEDVLENWIERTLIDQTAMGRDYKQETEMKASLGRYENELLKQKYIDRIILPQVKMTDDELESYYAVHQRDYMKPAHYRLQQISAKTEKEAGELMKSLQNGADFSWLLRQRSKDPSPQDQGDRGWMIKAELPKQCREVIDNMNAGELSPVIRIDESNYLIFKMQGKLPEQVEDFEKVRMAVRQALWSEKVNSLLQQYLTRLREGADIKVFGKEIKALEARLQK